MSPTRSHSSCATSARELARLHARLAEAEETLRAIRTGEVDAVVVADGKRARVFTLDGAEHAYRVLIESMNEGALTLTADKTVLYANRCFARMVKCPLQQVIGSSLRSFLCAKDRAALRPLLRRAGNRGSKIQVQLIASDGSQIAAQVSVRALASHGHDRATFGVVVSDMTAARHSEEMLRMFSHRLVQVQEAERGRVARELHDGITQLLCGILFRLHALADRLPARDGPLKDEAVQLCEMLGRAGEDVERISRDLRPGVLDELGLVGVLRASGAKFTSRTGVALELTCGKLAARLPADTELALYRIFQETLKNVEKHARARHVTVCLRKRSAAVELVIHDDGVGFDSARRRDARKDKGGLGLLGMRERANDAGGTLEVKSMRRGGTEIEVRIPLPPCAKRAS